MTDRGEGAPRDRARGRSVSGRGPAEDAIREGSRRAGSGPSSPAGSPASRRGGLPAHGLTPAEIAALVLSLAWLGLNGWWLLTLGVGPAGPPGAGPMGLAWTVMAVVLPVALVWVAAGASRTARRLDDESARLDAVLDALRHADAERRLAGSALRQAVEDRLGEIVRTQARLDAEVAATRARAARNPAPKGRRAADPEPEPDPEPGATPLLPEEFIRAFDFPRDEHDAEGFRVLRAALEHPASAPLVTATQDLLTLMAEDGIHMDDLKVDPADAVLWRAFADGMQGSEVAALGGIRDRSSLALAGGRMKDDPAFRKAVEHFLETFSRVFAGFADRASDAEIMRFADTRTARAFMLTARVAGLFA